MATVPAHERSVMVNCHSGNPKVVLPDFPIAPGIFFLHCSTDLSICLNDGFRIEQESAQLQKACDLLLVMSCTDSTMPEFT